MSQKTEKQQIDAARIAAVLIAANEAATLEASNREDGGTCNMDTVVIECAEWSKKDINAINAACGNMIGERLTSKYWKGWRWVKSKTMGQANLRNRMVDAFVNYCHANGLDNVGIYYQMD